MTVSRVSGFRVNYIEGNCINQKIYDVSFDDEVKMAEIIKNLIFSFFSRNFAKIF
jgi:hypothetical protein